ncbi:ABC transporter permease [Kitasatospora sp. NPDC089509]|uniref:ABC transporter permease n=1 Tax=Kitasatospora sp. NPDC089509 TaxID=3364079 RepID=UPI00380DA0DE
MALAPPSAVRAASPGAASARRAVRLPPPAVLAAGAVLLLILLAGLLTGVSPTATDPVNALQPPGAAHPLGTDQLGRDVFARLVHGAGPALALGFGSTVLAVVGGAALGLAAALGGPVADRLLMRAADVLLALPATLLALLVIAVLGTGTGNLVLAIGIALVPGYGRLVRSEALLVRRSGYVEAAVTLGVPRRSLILRHVLPNSLAPLLTLATVGFGTALIAASGLSFLGLGPRPPSPEWGAMLSEGRGFLATAWWLGVFPGAAVTLTVAAVTVVGRHLQQRFTRRSP